MSLSEELRSRESFLTTVEVMNLLQKTRAALCERVRSGRIPAVRDGNAYLFDPRELAEWIEARSTNSGRQQHEPSLPNRHDTHLWMSVCGRDALVSKPERVAADLDTCSAKTPTRQSFARPVLRRGHLQERLTDESLGC